MSTTITLPDRFDVASVRAIWDQLRPALEAKAPVRIDGTKVDFLDGAGLQLLVSFQQTARMRAVPVTLDLSAAIQTFLTRAGLSPTLAISP